MIIETRCEKKEETYARSGKEADQPWQRTIYFFNFTCCVVSNFPFVSKLHRRFYTWCTFDSLLVEKYRSWKKYIRGIATPNFKKCQFILEKNFDYEVETNSFYFEEWFSIILIRTDRSILYIVYITQFYFPTENLFWGSKISYLKILQFFFRLL